MRKRKNTEAKTVKRRIRKRKRVNTDFLEKLTKVPETIRLVDIKYDTKIFKPMMTGTIVDQFFSNKGGIPRATNFIIVGDPGAGKTTVALDIACNVQRNNQGLKTLFISAEMNRIDMYEYMERYPKFGQIETLFLSEYSDQNNKLVIEKILETGYDLVLGDSFAEIQDSVQETAGLTSSSAEKWLIDLMCSHNQGNNKRKAYTTFLMIQQVTKGGKFVGSNKLKHNTTGMLEIRLAEQPLDPNTSRYLEFTKNRRGDIGKKLYFNLFEPENVVYNEQKWRLDQIAFENSKKEISELEKEAKLLEQFFESEKFAELENTEFN